MAVTVEPLPFREAIAAFQRRTGDPRTSFAWQDLFEAEHARSFTVAKSAGFDILDDVSKALQGGIEGGTFRDFAKELTPVLQAKGWWGRQLVDDPLSGDRVVAQLGSVRRLKTIFDTNMRVSYAAGHWASFERNKAARPFLRYVHLEFQEHPRLQHHIWHNTVLPVDHPWWKTHACPNGWGCHCTLQSLSQSDADRLVAEGVPLKFDAPPVTTRNWLNKRTGEITKVPDGIDPGWAYNPGQAGHQSVVRNARSAKVADAPAALREAGVDETVASDDFARFVENPEGTMPVLALQPQLARELKTRSTVALLSAETMAKQKQNHPELMLDDYRRLPSIGADPTIVIQDGETTLVFVRSHGDQWYHVAVKTTATRKAAFVTSFRLSSDADISRLIRRGFRIVVDNR